ncbi:PREDICTED: uncharacterized protein LOC105575021 [Cercocebus atys]|uniref:uncharacterized protein LOC105575021 n=1 Tax=Cercocebus atys TaxID=9531 RepID=UPI0005F37FDC|nr:PREDICTED: uncharacterized protein LOC105575021 [Cercocebus atys]
MEPDLGNSRRTRNTGARKGRSKCGGHIPPSINPFNSHLAPGSWNYLVDPTEKTGENLTPTYLHEGLLLSQAAGTCRYAILTFILTLSRAHNSGLEEALRDCEMVACYCSSDSIPERGCVQESGRNHDKGKSKEEQCSHTSDWPLTSSHQEFASMAPICTPNIPCTLEDSHLNTGKWCAVVGPHPPLTRLHPHLYLTLLLLTLYVPR